MMKRDCQGDHQKDCRFECWAPMLCSVLRQPIEGVNLPIQWYSLQNFESNRHLTKGGRSQNATPMVLPTATAQPSLELRRAEYQCHACDSRLTQRRSNEHQIAESPSLTMTSQFSVFVLVLLRYLYHCNISSFFHLATPLVRLAIHPVSRIHTGQVKSVMKSLWLDKASSSLKSKLRGLWSSKILGGNSSCISTLQVSVRNV